ncbi:hypothetical protein [Streptomyces sp. 8ZJF_21]|uniref:hypothetical protein n=1 Tax=Streptomyces sp. 8ZJF_21 TaxID=2903141 RepID=UPI001E5398E7|nr:hypothetical protein [Streptomyces sp. 8ZJF_21]MCD9589337.1 hypothetical protein [Streptomyces sp. 8ZJF_21]
MAHKWKVTLIAVGAVLAASTPFVWWMNGPDTAQMVGGSVQGVTGVASLIWALVSSPTRTGPEADDAAVDTGAARATAGGHASTGVRGPREAGGRRLRAERTGDATADGPGSRANTGVERR